MLEAESRPVARPDADVSYDAPAGAPRDAAGLPVAISLFADRAHVRETVQADAELAGFRLAQVARADGLDAEAARSLGDIVFVDAPVADAAGLATLDRLVERVARSGARLIVSTTIGALEPVMVAAAAGDPVMLVEPGRAERLVAFGEALAGLVGARVRELSDEDRVAVIRLVERVTTLAERLDGLMGDDTPRDGGAAFAFGTGAAGGGTLREHKPGQGGAGKPGLPDPRVVRAAIRKRQMRSRFFADGLFADPAWDILLDLTAARAEGRRVSVTSLCIASGVPPTTALRWIAQMTEQGLLLREEDMVDRRRAFVALSDKAVEAMARYFDAAGSCDCAGI
ncbi:MarR family transcriptional regulator [Alteriqipengyuania sp. 357]